VIPLFQIYDLSGNSAGFDTSPINLSGLNSHHLFGDLLKANITYSGGTPKLNNWGVSALYNQVPNAPSSPSPLNGVTGVSTSPTLSVNVSDLDGDTMDVSFYNAFDDSLIGTDTSVISGGTASVIWSGLSAGTTYNWYAIADDGYGTTQSSDWSFTTNYVPNAPNTPSPLKWSYWNFYFSFFVSRCF